jgi:hypothetical protein
MRIGTESEMRITFSFGKGFHFSVWKTVMPLMILGTLCACVLRWFGVL